MDGETLGGGGGGPAQAVVSGITPGERKSVHGMEEDLYVGSGHPVRVGFQLGLNAGYVYEGRADN